VPGLVRIRVNDNVVAVSSSKHRIGIL
jgi:hypothetical protein